MQYHSLKQCIKYLESSFDTISESRKTILISLATIITKELSENNIAKTMSICTHNSRRSQLMEAWIVAAAQHYNVDGIGVSSGGTEATAFNIRMVVALRQAGFQLIQISNDNQNPNYILIPGKETVLEHVMYSKMYSAPFNPQSGFIAIMVCDSADDGCPIVLGAKHRISLHYSDPKIDDDTPMEQSAYINTVELIGREILFMMSKVGRL